MHPPTISFFIFHCGPVEHLTLKFFILVEVDGTKPFQVTIVHSRKTVQGTGPTLRDRQIGTRSPETD